MLVNDAATTSIIKSVPDTNTKEAILYGSEYIFAKSAKYFWDQVEDNLRKRMAETLTEIQDLDFARFVVNEAPHLFTISNPPLEIDQIRDLRVLSEWIGLRKALYLLEIRRKENDQYARLVGVSEYSQQRGTITETDWKAAILQSNDPLDYESIRAIKDMDAKLSEYESHYAQERMNAYRKYRGMVERELEEESDATELIDDTEDNGLDSIEIYKEIEIEEDGSEEEDDLEEPPEDSEGECDDAAELIDESEKSQEPDNESPDIDDVEAEEDIQCDVPDETEEECDDAAELLECEESIEEEENVNEESEISESDEDKATEESIDEEETIEEGNKTPESVEKEGEFDV